MRTATFAALLALAVPALAQTESRPSPQPEVETQKLWKITTTGLGG